MTAPARWFFFAALKEDVSSFVTNRLAGAIHLDSAPLAFKTSLSGFLMSPSGSDAAGAVVLILCA